MRPPATLPPAFVWQRYGRAEAGLTIQAILERKEQERAASGGLFLWGVGNSLMRQLDRLVASSFGRPLVLFSQMTSRPKEIDEFPTAIVSWRAGHTADRTRYELPDTLTVTSRDDGAAHYALVGHSDVPLQLWSDGPLVDRDRAVHLETGRRIADSAVTAPVRIDPEAPAIKGEMYPVVFAARLVEPYFVRLTEAG